MSLFRLFCFYVQLSISCLFISCGAITESYWIKRKLTEIIKSRYYKSFDVDTEIRCGVLCSQLFKWRELYYKSNVCYCLAPNYSPLSETIGHLTIDVGDSVYEMFRDRSDCISRNYTMFSGTNYCLKMIKTRLNWTDAENYCKKDGGNLASMETLDKWVHGFRTSKNHRFLAGGYAPVGSLNEKLEYRWISNRNTPINTTFWRLQDPNLPLRGVVRMYAFEEGIVDVRPSFVDVFMCEILSINKL